MNDKIKRWLLKGYEETKQTIDPVDKKYKIVKYEPIKKHFNIIEKISTYYNSEFDEYDSEYKGKESFLKAAYSLTKTLMQMRYFSIDKVKTDNLLKKHGELPSCFDYINEIFCSDVLIQIFMDYVKTKYGSNKYPPFCVQHFTEMIEPYVISLKNLRFRIDDITPGLIGAQFETMKQRLENLSAHNINKLLNRSSFFTYLEYWGKKPGKLGLMYCDVDKFGLVNKDNSQAVGDKVLYEIANVLSIVSEKYNGILARPGGEEFWLAFYNAGNDLDFIFKKIQQKLAKIERPNCKKVLLESGIYKKHMTISAAGGIAPVLQGYHRKKIEKWFDQLDKKGVHYVKENGRDGFKFVNLR
jgi:diguanylate cyclase (GGDEF)-like protein